MKGFQARVVVERKELNEKIVKLNSFLFSEGFTSVDWNTRELLLEQLFLMMDYSKTLSKRIYNFIQQGDG